MEDIGGQPVQYPTLLAILKHRKEAPVLGASLVILLICWCGFRSDMADLYALAVIIGLCVYFVLKAAIEVIDLIAETLMPR